MMIELFHSVAPILTGVVAYVTTFAFMRAAHLGETARLTNSDLDNQMVEAPNAEPEESLAAPTRARDDWSATADWVAEAAGRKD